MIADLLKPICRFHTFELYDELFRKTQHATEVYLNFELVINAKLY